MKVDLQFKDIAIFIKHTTLVLHIIFIVFGFLQSFFLVDKSVLLEFIELILLGQESGLHI